MSGTSGSSGFGSHSKEHMDNKTEKKNREQKSVCTQISIKSEMAFSTSELILHIPIWIKMDKLWFYAPPNQNSISLGHWKKCIFSHYFHHRYLNIPPICSSNYAVQTLKFHNFQSDKSTQGTEVHFWIISAENPVTSVHGGWKSFIWKNPDLMKAHWIISPKGLHCFAMFNMM